MQASARSSWHRFEADLPNHVEQAGGYERHKVEALLRHRSQLESTMGIGGPEEAITPVGAS